MLQTIEAEIDVNGNVRLLEPLHLAKPTRALVTLLTDASSENILLPEITVPEERERTIEEIVRSMQSNLISPDAPHFTREELHERR
jgi:ABC-type uncharacterized transport system permease subunit